MSAGFKVVIAGGGIAGLTLANCLEKANINYVLLERRLDITPQVGASIGILANGCRIFDQLGCLKELHECVLPILEEYNHDKYGRLLAPVTDGTQLSKTRTGYDVAFGDRTSILAVLYNNLKDKSKVLVGKNLTLVRQTPTGVIAVCEDGTTYTGDILVGADGVNSKTRTEMWRLADEEDPELVKADKQSMSAEYKCLYGIASASAGIPDAGVHITYDKGKSLFTIIGKGGRTYYFAFEKLAKTYQSPNIPRYSEADKDKFAVKHGDMKITETVSLNDIYKHHVSSTLVALETATYRIWTRGRIACVGDSSHKMTPNAGSGGNAAMESAAALANSIKKLVDTANFQGEHPELSKVTDCLKEYQKSREIRAAAVIKASNFVTDLQALASWGYVLFANYGLESLDNFLNDIGADTNIGATMIDYLPPPETSLGGTMPFNPEQGDGQKESLVKRLLFALPFLALFACGLIFIDAASAIPASSQILHSGKIAVGNFDVSIMRSFYGIGWMDKIWTTINVFFTPSILGYDPIGRTQFCSFLADYGVIISIWSIEAVRRNNALTPAQLPGVFTMLAQLRGIGVIAPIFYFIHWILTPIASFKATDMRLTRLKYTRAILPAVFLTYYIPFLGAMFWPNLYQRQAWLFIWQMFPIFNFIAQLSISKLFKDTMRQDKLHQPKRDVPVMRYTVGIPILISAVSWLYTAFTAQAPLSQIFLPHLPAVKFTDLALCIREAIQWDEVLLFGSTYMWLGYWMWDAKHAGMINDGWIKMVLVTGMSTICVGPGATAGMLWLWREWVVTEKRHRAAITVESVARKKNGM